jgi:hypothetical protein
MAAALGTRDPSACDLRLKGGAVLEPGFELVAFLAEKRVLDHDPTSAADFASALDLCRIVRLE